MRADSDYLLGAAYYCYQSTERTVDPASISREMPLQRHLSWIIWLVRILHKEKHYMHVLALSRAHSGSW
jgi:hypothetical protein